MPLSDRPQSNKQHPVPQNIMDVEFKLIGDLTMRQFVYLFVCGISAYLSYLTVYGLFKWPAVITLVLLGLGLAFVPVEERGLDEWIVNFFKAINSQTQKIWRKEPQLPTAFLYDSLAVVKQEMITLAPASSRRKLEEYLRYKGDEEKVDPLDIPEKDYAMKVHQAYPDQPMVSGSGVGIKLEEFIPTPVVSDEIFGGGDESLREPILPIKEDSSSNEKKFEEVEELEKLEKEEKLEKVEKTEDVGKFEHVVKKEIPVNMGYRKEENKEIKVITPALRIHEDSAQIIKSRFVDAKGFKLPNKFESRDSSFSFNPITPDMHSGRKFVNLVPSQGVLTLPIRGERTLRTSDVLVEQESLDEKAKKLNELLDKIRKEEGISKNLPKKGSVLVPSEPEVKLQQERSNVEEKAKDLATDLKMQNEDLAGEIDRLKDQIKRGKSMSLNTSTQEQLLRRLESQKEKIALSYTDLQHQFQDLQKKLEEKETSSVTYVPNSSQVKRVVPTLTTDANVVTGIVRDTDDKLLPNVLLIIKNMRGEAVRAIKTNSLGQFVVSTALQNGTYTIEVSPSNKLNLSFGIIPIEVKGEIITPLDIVGK